MRLVKLDELKPKLGEIGAIFQASLIKHSVARPLFSSRVPAGFPSPAEDYIEKSIDLNHELIQHPLSTFYLRVIGDSMEPLIHQDSLIVVDRLATAKSGDIVVAQVCGELCVKKMEMKDGEIWLHSENQIYEPIQITEEMDFQVWGRVLHVIYSF
ncbi:MAG TPA: translesion error-prone DNA polymerase V autoproteolytic subunit [Pyrinomonadaceae bacterium]|jgi:DNA polymerase V